MLGEINYSLEPEKPHISLARPNKRKESSTLDNFIYGLSHEFNYGDINELSFKMPYDVLNENDHILVRNKYIDKIYERYLLKVESGEDIEWYIINQISDDMDDTKDIKSVHAYSLGYELKDKIIEQYNVVSKTILEVATEILEDTLWGVGNIDPSLYDAKRGFDVQEVTLLDFIKQVADSFNALIEYDTVNRLIHFRKVDLESNEPPLTLGYGKYLKTLNKTSESDEMVTRLYVYGKDGMSINRVNPSGTNYIEDFSYFMQGFERDENRNVIKSSPYMTDDLCHAILDYNELIESKEGVFSSLLEEQVETQQLLTTKKNELFYLETDQKIISNIVETQKGTKNYFYKDNTYSNKTETVKFNLTTTNYYVVMLRLHSNSLTVKIDNSTVTPPSLNTWFVAKKVHEKNALNVNCSGTGRIEILIMEITVDEYDGNDNQAIIDKYNLIKKNEEVAAKKIEIEEVNDELEDVKNRIVEFQNEISIENNFTPEQIEERKPFIIDKIWKDENYFDEDDLYNAAKEKFLEYKIPKTNITINIVNLLQIIEEQHNWKRLRVGREARIRYDKINVNVKAKITKLSISYDDNKVNVTIANIKDLFGNAARFLEMLKSSYSTSTSVQSSKSSWNSAVEKANFATEKLTQPFDATEFGIQAGVNGSITINEKGICARNPLNLDEMIIIQSGLIAISKNGGEDWQTLVSPEGFSIGDLMGKLILNENLEITNEEGTLLINDKVFKIQDRNDIVRVLLGEYEADKFGLKVYDKTGRKVIIDEDGMMQFSPFNKEDNVDVNSGLLLSVLIPENTKSIYSANLRFKLLPFRSYSSVTDSTLPTIANLDSLTNTIEIPSHSHNLTHGIYTGTSASGVGVIINGVDRTVELGGKFTTDVDNLDITQYLMVGWNEILLTSETLGRLDANIFVEAFQSYN